MRDVGSSKRLVLLGTKTTLGRASDVQGRGEVLVSEPARLRECTQDAKSL